MVAPGLVVAVEGATRLKHRSERVDLRHDVRLRVAGRTQVGPALVQLVDIRRVVHQLVPEERHELLVGVSHEVVARVAPSVHLVGVVVAGCAVGDVEVPERRLPLRVGAEFGGVRLAVLVERRTESVGVYVARHLLRNLVVDERRHVDILAVSVLARVVGRGESVLHRGDGVVDSVLSARRQVGEVVVLRLLILVSHDAVGILHAACTHRMVLRHVVVLLVLAVDLNMEVAREVVGGRVVEVETGLALRGALRHDVHAVVVAVDEHLAILHVRRERMASARQLHGEHVAHVALVLPRSQQRPVVVLAHAHDRHLRLLRLQVGGGERLQRERLLVRPGERGVAAILQRYRTFPVYLLRRVRREVGVVVSVAVVDNLHRGEHAALALNYLSVDRDVNDRERGLAEGDVGRRSEVVLVGVGAQRTSGEGLACYKCASEQ